jgi:hypothetical protein
VSADREDGEPDTRLTRRAAAEPAPPEEILAEETLAEQVRYREVVAARYEVTAARDAWTRAVPGLRAEWAAHKQRYPGQPREAAVSEPDGSWRGSGGRRLSPEQNAEAGKCAADLRDEARQAIRPAVERVAAADPGRQLAGLEHMLKGEDRLKEKIAEALTARPELTATQAVSIVPDSVRFTLCYPSERYADGVLADVHRLKSEGFELIKLKNLWEAEQYKGVNSQWKLPDTGTRFEMQFHTPESWEAKELTHEAYERIRAAEARPAGDRDVVEEEALEDFQRRVNSLLMTPPGTEAIENFPRSKDARNG